MLSFLVSSLQYTASFTDVSGVVDERNKRRSVDTAVFVDRQPRVEQESRKSNKPRSLPAAKLYDERVYVRTQGSLKQGSKKVRNY
jgi:hypothetical protein